MNKFIGVGRLTKDGELQYLANANGLAKLQFTVAIDRAYQKDKNNKKTDFINCVVLGKRAENLSPYVTKGKLVAITGELNIDSWKDNEGNWKNSTSVNIDTFEFLSDSKSGGKSEEPSFEPSGTFSPTDFDLDDSLPF